MGFQVVIVTCSHKNTNTEDCTVCVCVYVCSTTGWLALGLDAHIGIRSRLSDLKAKHTHTHKRRIDEREIFLAVSDVCSILSSLYSLPSISTSSSFSSKSELSAQTNNEHIWRSTASAELGKKMAVHIKTSTKRTSTSVGTRSFRIFIFVLCLLQLYFLRRFFLFLFISFRFQFFCFFSFCYFVATKLKSKHKVGYVARYERATWARATINMTEPTSSTRFALEK